TFRVRITGLCTTIFSNAATLFVNPLPTISIDAVASSSLLPGQSANLMATANPSGGSYAWRFNGNTISNTTAATYGPLSIDNIGAYSVVYTDPNGCITTSNSINLTGLASTNVWLYPNPNNGQFQVRFYNQLNEKATIMIYNAGGQVVMQKAINTGTPYSQTDIDLGLNAAGIYVLKVVTADGRELANKRVILYR
ncbi:MAG: Secretion system C-terminal sorting domain, partial [Bacteroidota bacterium]